MPRIDATRAVSETKQVVDRTETVVDKLKRGTSISEVRSELSDIYRDACAIHVSDPHAQAVNALKAEYESRHGRLTETDFPPVFEGQAGEADSKWLEFVLVLTRVQSSYSYYLPASDLEALSRAVVDFKKEAGEAQMARDLLLAKLGERNDPGRDRPGRDRPGRDRPGPNRPGRDRPGRDRPGRGGGATQELLNDLKFAYGWSAQKTLLEEATFGMKKIMVDAWPDVLDFVDDVNKAEAVAILAEDAKRANAEVSVDSWCTAVESCSTDAPRAKVLEILVGKFPESVKGDDIPRLISSFGSDATRLDGLKVLIGAVDGQLGPRIVGDIRGQFEDPSQVDSLLHGENRLVSKLTSKPWYEQQRVLQQRFQRGRAVNLAAVPHILAEVNTSNRADALKMIVDHTQEQRASFPLEFWTKLLTPAPSNIRLDLLNVLVTGCKNEDLSVGNWPMLLGCFSTSFDYHPMRDAMEVLLKAKPDQAKAGDGWIEIMGAFQGNKGKKRAVQRLIQHRPQPKVPFGLWDNIMKAFRDPLFSDADDERQDVLEQLIQTYGKQGITPDQIERIVDRFDGHHGRIRRMLSA